MILFTALSLEAKISEAERLLNELLHNSHLFSPDHVGLQVSISDDLAAAAEKVRMLLDSLLQQAKSPQQMNQIIRFVERRLENTAKQLPTQPPEARPFLVNSERPLPTVGDEVVS
jgi:hypothetical protein